MPRFLVATPQHSYPAVVERHVIAKAAEFLPAECGKIFIVTTRDVWQLHGATLQSALGNRDFATLFFIGGEDNKRLSHVERMAGEMAENGADRSSIVIAFGGGIVNDLGGFLAALFMRGIPVIQTPPTLLAQVDAAVGGKTGANLIVGKNLIGAFHQPLAVLIDPAVLSTLPEREYRSGLYEILKHGVIADAPLFQFLHSNREAVFAKQPAAVDRIVADSVGLKAEVVTEDEKETGRRKILNFGHTFGHALEAETRYTRFLHGEAVAWGMRAATYLAHDLKMLSTANFDAILELLNDYGPIPSTKALDPVALQSHMVKDKKTIRKKIHLVLPTEIGKVAVHTEATEAQVLAAIEKALADTQ